MQMPVEVLISDLLVQAKGQPTPAPLIDVVGVEPHHTDRPYAAGERVWYDGRLYEAILAMEPREFALSDWRGCVDSKLRPIYRVESIHMDAAQWDSMPANERAFRSHWLTDRGVISGSDSGLGRSLVHPLDAGDALIILATPDGQQQYQKIGRSLH